MSASGTRAENALAPFVQLGKSQKNLAAAKNIEKAVNHPNTFVFGELLELPNVRALAGTEYRKHLALLELFAYGTVAESKANAAQLLPLSNTMLKKLRMLTVVTVASNSPSGFVDYQTLMAALDLSNVRELEDVIISCIYAELLEGKLFQRQKKLRVDACASRDVAPDRILSMVAVLQHLSDRCDSMMLHLADSAKAAEMSYMEDSEQVRGVAEKMSQLLETERAEKERRTQQIRQDALLQQQLHDSMNVS